MAVNWLPFRFPGLPGVQCAFQCRAGHDTPLAGGNISFAVADDRAAVTGNRRALFAGLGLDAVAELHQVHGDVLRFDPPAVAPDASPALEGDGMATDIPGLALCIKTADCQPVLLAHRHGRHIAALHVGWRGNRCDFPASGVDAFCRRYDLRPADLFAVRGPSLGPGRAEFVNFDAEWGQDFARWFDARQRTMDLWSCTRHQLQSAGLPPSQICGLDCCTATLEELFFSHRRNRASGRQGNFIWIER